MPDSNNRKEGTDRSWYTALRESKVYGSIDSELQDNGVDKALLI